MDMHRHAQVLNQLFRQSVGVCATVLVASSMAVGAPSLEDVNAALGLRGSDVQVVDVVEQLAGTRHLDVELGGDFVSITLERHSVRGIGYRVLVQAGPDDWYEAAPGPVNTWSGTIDGRPGSRVTASIDADGFRAGIRLPDGSRWWVESIDGRVRGAAPGDAAVYESAAIISPDGWCGTDDVAHRIGVQVGGAGQGTQRSVGTEICTAELACDADWEFYQDYGSVSGVENRINSIINAMNDQYETEVQLTHLITTIIVRTTSSDPYSGSSMSGRLDQMRSHWESSQGGIERDVAQLFTGIGSGGGTIGIAWLSAVCSSYGYSVVQADCCGSFGCATDLSAHELGHNWGADHCSCSSNTMNPSLTCSNTFSSNSQSDINSYQNSVPWCLDCATADPTGGCCVGTSCSVVTQAECSASGGTWLGAQTDCANEPCSPTGACCVGNSCTIATESSCSGTWNGAGSDCSNNPCNAATGGCCVGVSCSVSIQSDCSGTWLGDGTDCSGSPCNTSGFEGITTSIVGHDLVSGTSPTWTVDVYAAIGAGERLDAVAGNSVQQKMITSSGGFYQDAYGGATSQWINPGFFVLAPDLEWDSRVTIGARDQSGDPFGENQLGDIGIDWTNFEAGGDLSAGDGTWFVLPTHEQGEARAFIDSDCQSRFGVLIATLTTYGYDSQIMVEALFQGRDASDETWQAVDSVTIGYQATEDCNANGVADSCDIANGNSSDDDGNGVPDECDASCAWDLDGNGETGIDDLLAVISDYGNPYTVDDLLALLAEYGCEG